ncbi:MAG: IPT/TIG domain-containing protein [Myxococcota bacterium]
MKNPKCRLVVIIGAVFLLAGCSKPTTKMGFERLDPDFGGLQGGKSVRVVGENIRLDIGYSVLFGKAISPRVSIENDTALLAVTPRVVTPGPVDVVVRTDDGSVFRINGGFEYVNQGGQLLGDEAEAAPEAPE